MYNDKIYLTPQEILEHDFKIDARGYRPQEVDKYLDMIIRDYTEYNSIIRSLEKKLKDLSEDNYTLKQEIRRLQVELETAEDASNSQKSVTNIDLLRRISQLEKVVYGKNE
ncbi:MAG: cell division regulator GpsB [Firmicutes bacterium]|nr:cell division regulator GpsB [Bacillota bacterium]